MTNREREALALLERVRDVVDCWEPIVGLATDGEAFPELQQDLLQLRTEITDVLEWRTLEGGAL